MSSFLRIFLPLLIIAISGFVLFKNHSATLPVDKQTSAITVTSTASVSSPTQEDVIRLFFNLLKEHRIPEAVELLSSKNINSDSQKQSWGIMFNAFQKIELLAIKSAGENTFEVEFDAQLKPETATAEPIPYYGFSAGRNIRWITLEKESDLWKIADLATGP